MKKQILLLLLIFCCIAPLATQYATGQGSQSAITSAKNTLNNCYQAVSDAEAAGADVSSLMVTLNQAAALLSKAELANAAGDYNAANDYASQSQSKLNGFTTQAAALTQSATVSNAQNSMPTLLSLFISAILFVSGISAWIILYRRERRNNHGV